MKPLCLFFITVLLSSCLGGSGSNNSPLTDWERMNLNGKVKEIVGYSRIAEGDFGEFGRSKTDTGRLSYIAHFNKEGYLLEEVNYENSEHRVYTNKDLTEREEMKVYNWVGVERTGEETLTRTHKFEYNDQGQLIKETIKRPASNDVKVRVYEYDSKGNRTLDYSPLFGTILKLEYNDKGQAVKYWAYKSQLDYMKKRGATEGYRKYDKDGNMIEEGWSDFKRIFRYDKDRNMLERTSVHSKTDIRERLFLYQSDEQNNWILRTKKDNRYLSERVITYF